MTSNINDAVSNEKTWYQAITGRPYSKRPHLNSERNELVKPHAVTIGSFEDREMNCFEFAEAFASYSTCISRIWTLLVT